MIGYISIRDVFLDCILPSPLAAPPDMQSLLIFTDIKKSFNMGFSFVLIA